MVFDFIFDALFASAPKWVQYAIIAISVVLLASLFGWLWYAGNLK